MWYHDDYSNIELSEQPTQRLDETPEEFSERAASINPFND